MAPRQRITPRSSSSEDLSSSGATATADQPLLGPGNDDEVVVAAAAAANSSSSINSNNATTNATKMAKTEMDDQASEIAREQHDIFNLAALLIVLATTYINYNIGDIFKGYSPEKAFHGNHFLLNWLTCQLYFLADLTWVLLVPICVKSPGTIVKHHLVVIIYLVAPLYWSEFRWFVGAMLTVEINTWFLILRRVLYKRQEKVYPTIIIVDLVNFLFYTSWLVIRCVIFPLILCVFLNMAHEAIQETGQFWHWPMIFIPVHAALCLLQFKWTYDLFKPIVKKWLFADNTVVTVSNGL